MADVTFTFSGDASELNAALSEIKQEVSKTKEAVGGMAGKFAIAFAAIQAGIAAVKSAFSSLGEISSAAAAMEQTSLAFTVMMGDAATAAEYVAQLKKYAAETPFEFGDISDAAKTLLSMGTEAEKSIEVIKRLGDIASVSGKPLRELAFLYAKAQNAGLTNEVAESLEMQGVPIRRMLAEMKGISFEQVFQGISKRQFGLADLDAVLAKLTGAGGLLENMTQRQSRTFSGMLSTLTDGFNALAVELGTPINAAMMPVMQELTAYLESITPQVQEFAQGIASCFTGIVDVISPIISGIGSLVEMLGGAKTVVASLAAAMLMYVGNSKAATASTVSLRGSMASLVTTIKGLNMTTFVAGFKSAMTGIRSAMAASLTGMKVMWSTAWTTMATVTRAAMVAVKAAIVSTGIGLIIVGIGEALGALYSWFMGNSEAAKEAAQSAREFEKSLKGLNKRASKITTHEQYEDFIESLDEQIADLQSRRREAELEDKDELVKALTRQIHTLYRKRSEYRRTIPLQIEAAEAAEREAAAARAQAEAQEELRKKIEATQQRMVQLYKQNREMERERYLSELDTETQIRLRLSDAGGFQSLEELQKAIRDMENRIGWANVGDDERYERLIKTRNKILELRRQQSQLEERERRKQQEDAEKARQTAEEATRDYVDRMALLQAEIAQDEKKLEILKRQQRIVELTADYRRKGLEDAEQLARQMVEAELNAEIAREKNREKQNRSATRMSSAWIQGSQAGVGGGGRSYLIGGGPMLTESKKHTTLLREVRDAVRKRQQVKVTGNVEAVLGD